MFGACLKSLIFLGGDLSDNYFFFLFFFFFFGGGGGGYKANAGAQPM